MANNEELLKESGVSIIKGALGAVPFIGTAINEFFFETRSRLKQKRINLFINNLSDYMSKFNEAEIDISQVQNDEFSDIFEEIIINVSRTHSKNKIDAYKNLLCNQLVEPRDINHIELLINIISSIHEKQILILKGFSINYDSLYNTLQGELIAMENQFHTLDKEISNKLNSLGYRSKKYIEEVIPLQGKRDKLESLIKKTIAHINAEKKPFTASTYKCSDYEFAYLIQDLCNKGLLLDIGQKHNADALSIVEITQLGHDFIDFIDEYK